ncbi:MAG: HAMP domain-containing sensor histidine kinase [Myxococcota bacterium]
MFEEVELRVEVPETLAVEADPGMLRHVLVNLLFHGAVHAGPGHRVVVVSAAPDEADAAAVRIRVRSSGAALGAEAKRRAFEPFFATRAGGSGLGLAVVRRLVEEQHGRVAIDHDVAEGLSVSVWLLCAGGPAEAASPGPARPSRVS